jgi:hypothetical protein
MPPSPWIGSINTATDVLVVRRDLAHRVEVVQRHAHEALHQRLEACLDLAAAGRPRASRASAVEGLFHDDDGGLGDAAVVAVLARHLDARLVGLEARVAEEHLVQPVICAMRSAACSCSGIWKRFELCMMRRSAR